VLELAVGFHELPAVDGLVDDRLDARLDALKQAVVRVRAAAREGDEVTADDIEAVYSELDEFRILVDRVAADVADTPYPIDQSAYMDYDALTEEFDRQREQAGGGAADD
jgi:hypothetical protein